MHQMKTLELFDKVEDLFVDESILTHKYIPDNLPGREEQIEALAYHLRAALKGKAPSNILIYGKTGTGKTIVTDYILRQLKIKAVEEEATEGIHSLYISCPQAPTETQILQGMINTFSNTFTQLRGWGIDKHYQTLKDVLTKKKGIFILVLDEIDKLKTDTPLYNLTRLSIKKADISIIGISNNLKFIDGLDPRVKSSFGEEQLIFPPYNAIQLETILQQRAKTGIKKGALSSDVIPLCAALAAQREGDARKAIDMLRVAVQLAEREGKKEAEEQHVRKALYKIDMDRIKSVVSTAPLQQKAVLFSIIVNEQNGKENTTGTVYETYRNLCPQISMHPSTMKWVSDIIGEFNMLGIVDARVISQGRYGRTTKVILGAPLDETKAILLSDESLAPLKNYSDRKKYF